MEELPILQNCMICPRNCGIDRTQTTDGYCHTGKNPKISLVSVHHWEEPCISGTKGSGTIFFTGCNLKCIFCQNYTISSENYGKEVSIEQLAEIYLKQQKKGVHNINLVTPSHFLPQIRQSLLLAKKNGLSIPIVYNTNAYEKVEYLKSLEGLIDIYLPDFKYFSSDLSKQFSGARDYFQIAANAILEMVRQTGVNQFDKQGLLKKGVIIRHLILPNCRKDSEKILDWIKNNLGNQVYVSLLNQYTPMYFAKERQTLNRRLTSFEYQKVADYFLKIGLENGYLQKKSSATETYIPIFDLTGIDD